MASSSVTSSSGAYANPEGATGGGIEGYDNPGALCDTVQIPGGVLDPSDCRLDIRDDFTAQGQGHFIHSSGTIDSDSLSLDEELDNTEFTGSVLELESGTLNQVTTYVDIHETFGTNMDTSRH